MQEEGTKAKNAIGEHQERMQEEEERIRILQLP